MAQNKIIAPEQFRRRIAWAILSTNLFGLPIIFVFLIILIGIPFSQLFDALSRSPLLLGIGFGAVGGAGVVFVLGHFIWVLYFMKPIFEYLKAEQEKESELKDYARKAMLNSATTPYFTMILSIAFYFIAILLLLVILNFLFKFTLGQALSLFSVPFGVGVLISFFQYFSTRAVLIGLNETIVRRFPELVEDEGLNYLRIRFRDKMLVAVVILCLSLVVITGILSYTYALRSFQYNTGKLYLKKINLLGEPLLPGSEASFSRYAKNLSIDPSDYIFLVDEEGEVIYGVYPSELKNIWYSILKKKEKLKGAFSLVSRLSKEEIYGAVFKHKRYTVVHYPVDMGWSLFVISPEKERERYLRALWGFAIFACFFALLLGFLYTRLATMDIDLPLRRITRSIQRVAEGNLEERVVVISQDEIGILALNLSRMIKNLRNMIGRIEEASSSISETSDQLAHHSEEIEQGANLQASSVEETNATIEEMNQSIHQIAEGIETLAKSAEESSASILEMSATIDEIAENVETLSEAVEETTSSLQEMNASLQEVASNVQQLSARSEEAIRSLQEMENAIWSVGKSSDQTAQLSAQVAEDAEQGAKAVELTIKGIERIRASSEEAAMVIDSLSERAQEIGNILNVIDDITEETNLLALNAAIIAAQAGEHGRGFAVVADEIRDLAERTSTSTREIAELIKAVQEGAQNAVATVFKSSKDVEEGVKLSQEAGAALSQILERARTSMERTREIASAVAQQSEHTKEVMTFFEKINSMIAQVAQAIQEQSRGSDLIFRASQRMEQVAKQVKRATREQSLGSKQITQAIENIAQIVNYINTAQNEQLKNAQVVLEAVRHIRKVAEENSERVKELRNVVEGLSFLASDLKEMVEQFKLHTPGAEETRVEEVFKI